MLDNIGGRCGHQITVKPAWHFLRMRLYFLNFDVSALQKYVGFCVHLIWQRQSWG